MKYHLSGLAALALSTLAAQTPNFSGIWKVDPEKSQFGGPTPSSYWMLIDQQDSKLSLKMAVGGPHGVERATYNFNLEGKPSLNTYRGLPMRTIAAWNNGVLTLDSKTAGQPMTITVVLSLSPDGNTLNAGNTIHAGGSEIKQALVFDKQPDSAGEALRKPEETAGALFKNVQVLKDMPASDFLNAMRSFSMSLGSRCDLCHVDDKFESDDKPAKAMARKMIAMTHAINEQNFGGQQEVRCYTCHQGKPEPQSRPAFQ